MESALHFISESPGFRHGTLPLDCDLGQVQETSLSFGFLTAAWGRRFQS